MSNSTLASIDVRAQRMTAGNLPISINQVDFSRGEVIDAPCQDFVLCFIQHGSGDVRSSFDGSRSRQQYVRSGMFLPMTLPDMRAEFLMTTPMRHLVLTLPVRVFDAWAHDHNRSIPDAFASLQDSGFQDSLLEQIVLAIWSEAEANNAGGALFADALLMTLAGALLRRGDIAVPPARPACKLSKQQVARVEEYLAHHIRTQVTIAELAAVVDMHERTFATAFKNASGKSPYQYLMNHRIERAKIHLGDSAMSISEIAEMTGFADQAHLTSTFSRRVGMSPGRYRRTIRW